MLARALTKLAKLFGNAFSEIVPDLSGGEPQNPVLLGDEDVTERPVRSTADDGHRAVKRFLELIRGTSRQGYIDQELQTRFFASEFLEFRFRQRRFRLNCQAALRVRKEFLPIGEDAEASVF